MTKDYCKKCRLPVRYNCSNCWNLTKEQIKVFDTKFKQRLKDFDHEKALQDFETQI